MATNSLKFVSDIEVMAKSLAGDSVRRSFDALDEMRTENARLRRELIEAREENRQLREQIDKLPLPQIIASTTTQVQAQQVIQAPERGDAEIRFSLLELDVQDS